MTTQTPTKHTPGPWKVDSFDWEGRPDAVDNDVEYFSTIYGLTEKGAEFIIADMCGVPSGIYAKSTGQADARLIAAAPEMLEALIAVMDVIPFATNPIDSEIHQRAYAVIRKAKGELS